MRRCFILIQGFSLHNAHSVAPLKVLRRTVVLEAEPVLGLRGEHSNTVFYRCSEDTGLTSQQEVVLVLVVDGSEVSALLLAGATSGDPSSGGGDVVVAAT